MNLADLGSPREPDTTNPFTNEPADLSPARIAALRDQTMSIRAGILTEVLASLEKLDAAYPSDVDVEDLDRDALLAARYAATMTNALASFVVTGIVPAIPGPSEGYQG